MHPDFYQLAELAVGLVALFGLGVGVKVLVWDRLPENDGSESRRTSGSGSWKTGWNGWPICTRHSSGGSRIMMNDSSSTSGCSRAVTGTAPSGQVRRGP